MILEIENDDERKVLFNALICVMHDYDINARQYKTEVAKAYWEKQSATTKALLERIWQAAREGR